MCLRQGEVRGNARFQPPRQRLPAAPAVDAAAEIRRLESEVQRMRPGERLPVEEPGIESDGVSRMARSRIRMDVTPRKGRGESFGDCAGVPMSKAMSRGRSLPTTLQLSSVRSDRIG